MEDREEVRMIDGTCHCGKLRWWYDGVPESATACNCTICRRYGALWAYDFEGEGFIRVSGPTRVYAPGALVGFHACPDCGCVAYWRSLQRNERGRWRLAVNLRLAEPDAVARIPIDHFDGLRTFEELPRDGRCVADYWF
jgi:hypothetical protein